MKNIFLIISLLIVNFMFSGCSTKEVEIKKNFIETDNGITMTIIHEDVNLKKIEKDRSENNSIIKKNYKSDNLMLKQALELISKETLAKGKTNFLLINTDTNNLIGFPINNYNDLNKYCLNYNRDSGIEIICSVFKEFSEFDKAIFRFIILEKEDYKIASFNAKEVLEELKKETQPIN